MLVVQLPGQHLLVKKTCEKSKDMRSTWFKLIRNDSLVKISVTIRQTRNHFKSKQTYTMHEVRLFEILSCYNDEDDDFLPLHFIHSPVAPLTK